MNDLSQSLLDFNLERLIPTDISLRKNIATSLYAGEVDITKDNFGGHVLMRNGIPYSDTIDAMSESVRLANSIKMQTHISTVGFFGMGIGYLVNNFKDSKIKLVVFDPDLEAIGIALALLNFDRLNLKIVSSVSEFVTEGLDLIIVNDSTKSLFPEIYQELEKLSSSENEITKKRKQKKPRKQLKVLVQARSNILNARGGDSIALERSSEALRRLGVQMVIDPSAKENPKDYDLVHLYNFATPECLVPLAKNAINAGTPYVVTTLYEDRPAFYVQMSVYGRVMEEHFDGNMTNYNWDEITQIIHHNKDSFPDKGYLNNSFVAEHAECLLASGESEKQLLLRDYPEVRKIDIAHFGSQGLPDVSAELFEEKYGVSNFILCVGRLEWRKNQAMLMKAMEDCDLPLVLVKGNVTYQPDYEASVPYFKRKGETLTVSRLSLEELASAYKGALAHVLPSWYELPGLVTLEAARCGTPVVGTRLGTLHDYLGDLPYYCDPSDLDSIVNATNQAINTPRNSPRLKALKGLAESYTWENTARKILESYMSVLGLERSQVLLREDM